MPRGSIVASLVALPPIMAIAAMLVTSAPLLNLSGPTEGAPRSFAEAIVGRHGVEQVYAFIHEGTDASQPIQVGDGDLPGLGPGAVPPLVAAVAAGDGNVVQMLVDYSEPGETALHDAHCLALERGDTSSIAALERKRPSRGDDCRPSVP